MNNRQQPSYFGRFRLYGWSCIGHISQGAAAGVLAATGHWAIALIWMSGYLAYQSLSFARKISDTGHGDTAGYDSYDFVVGAVPAYALVMLLKAVM